MSVKVLFLSYLCNLEILKKSSIINFALVNIFVIEIFQIFLIQERIKYTINERHDLFC